MGILSKEEQARREGMVYSLRVAKERGIEGLEKDLKMRNATKMPLAVDKKATDEVIDMLAENCRRTVLLLMAYTVHDKFGFGKKRLNDLMDAFEENTQYLFEGYLNWNDLIEIMKDECGIDYEIDNDIVQLSIENSAEKYSERSKE